LRQDPFAVAVVDSRQAPGGPCGAYYFPKFVLINYTIVETRDGVPVIVIGPEVSTTADGMSPRGHPTLGTCANGYLPTKALIPDGVIDEGCPGGTTSPDAGTP